MFGTACRDDPESPTAKHEWSLLESTQAKYANQALEKLIFVKSDDYEIVGIPAKPETIWILLNPKTTPYYRQFPKGNYLLSTAQLQQIKSRGGCSPTVMECLLSHIHE